MSDKNESAEVSNRLIIVTGVLIVLVMLAVPLGYHLYPRIAERLRVKEEDNLELVFGENFENPDSSNAFSLPEGWATWNNPSSMAGKKRLRILINAESAKSGSLGLDMYGYAWATGVYRDLNAEPPLVIEFDMRMGGEPFTKRGGHQLRGAVGLCPESSNLAAAGPTCCLIHFKADKSIPIGRTSRFVSDKPANTAKWFPDRWYHVRLRYGHKGDKFFVTAELDGVKLKGREYPLDGWQKSWKDVQLRLQSGQGITYYDNIRVYRVVNE
jgi:hypothetical protein